MLEGKEQKEYVLGKGHEILDVLVDEHLAVHKDRGDWDLAGFLVQLRHFYGFDPEAYELDLNELGLDQISPAIWERLLARYDAKEEKVGADLMRGYERHILLQIIDSAWKDHLLAIYDCGLPYANMMENLPDRTVQDAALTADEELDLSRILCGELESDLAGLGARLLECDVGP